MKNIKKFALVVAFLGILIVPSFASAATVEELQAQISALLAQLQSLQAQLNQVQGTTQTWCHNFDVNLKIGMGGSEVVALQTALEKEGFSISSDEKNNQNFDESTASAVSGFQEKYADEILTPLGLKYGTGFVGKSTRAKLNALYGCGVKPRPEPPAKCPQYTPPLCKEGEKIISGGYDERGCSLPGKCVPVIPSITVLSPNGGEKWALGSKQYIKFQSNNVGKSVCLRLYRNNVYLQNIGCTVNATASGVTYEWLVPSNLAIGDGYKIFANTIDANGKEIYDYSDAPFSIVAAGTPSITVLSPNGGESWQIGKTYTIKWTANNIDSVDIVYRREGSGAEYNGVIATNQPSQGSYNFTVPANILPGEYKSGQFKIIIVKSPYTSLSIGGPVIFDSSDAPFSIVAPTTPSITVLSPNGGESFTVGQTIPIYFSTTLTDKQATGITLQLYRKTSDSFGKMFAQDIVINWNNGSPYNWTIPTTISPGDYFIYATAEGLRNVSVKEVWDFSDAPFSIVAGSAPVITSIFPTSGTSNDTITIYGKNLIDTIPSGIIVEFLKNGLQSATISSPITLSPDGSFLKFQLDGRLVSNSEPGVYQIRVVNDKGKSNTVDFTIISSTSMMTINQMANVLESAREILEKISAALWR